VIVFGMKIVTRLTGTSPLVMHNVRLARPDDPFTQAIAAITSKRSKMTDDDRREVARLEFAGSLYIDEDGPFVPAANVRRCFVRGATIRRLGTAVERALIPMAVQSPLEFDGPTDVDRLWKDPQFQYVTMVRVQAARTVRTRPQFPRWALTCEWELVTSALDLRDAQDVCSTAGLVEGIGDNRRNGYGRFTVEVSEA
jgi:hypothetical protein